MRNYFFYDQTLKIFYRHNSGFFKIKSEVTDFGHL